RQFTYSEESGALTIFINGRRFVGRGGNWGFSESNLLYRDREYDAAVRYHRDMGFTMIRNWVGQVGDDAFFDACDRYGVVVWQDFWLANPLDGPDPADGAMFLANAADFIDLGRRRRLLRRLRPLRRRGLAGLLAGQPARRPGSGRRRDVPGERSRLHRPHSRPPVGGPVLRPQRGQPSA